MDYKNAGVDIEAGYKSVELMKQHMCKEQCDRKYLEESADSQVLFPWTASRTWRSQHWFPVQTV